MRLDQRYRGKRMIGASKPFKALKPSISTMANLEIRNRNF